MTPIYLPQNFRSLRPARPAALLAGLTLALTLSACKSLSTPPTQVHTKEAFTTDSPFAYTSKQPPKAACETGKRALLSQGYRIEDDNALSLSGEKIFRPHPEKVARLGIKLVCLASGQGAVIYANAQEIHYELKSSGSSAGFSVSGMGSLSLPWTMDRNTMVKISEETITQASFYHRLFELIQTLEGSKTAAPAPAAAAPDTPAPAGKDARWAAMTLPDYTPAFYLVAVIAILLTGISKGGFGAAAGGLAVPILSLVITPPEAAGIMLPILCAMDVFAVYAWRGRWSGQHLRVLLPGVLAGIALGSLAFGLLPVDAIRLIVGLIAVLFALNKQFALGDRLAARLAMGAKAPGPLTGLICGACSGFTSTLAHAGGPPLAVYIYSQRLDKAAIVATSALTFCTANYVKLVPYFFLGQLSAGNLATSLLFAPLAPAGIWLGIWLNKRITEKAFLQISYLLLFLSGAKLIWDALA